MCLMLAASTLTSIDRSPREHGVKLKRASSFSLDADWSELCSDTKARRMGSPAASQGLPQGITLQHVTVCYIIYILLLTLSYFLDFNDRIVQLGPVKFYKQILSNCRTA